ncbi:MAG: DUF624 domain-containing protein [Ruminococcaceae bacterium]|nr:DUF624 domain-containing protein [Oscillospiraceae bacterium]
MANFFGLFNYEKEGPGVEKDAPQKIGFLRFFELYFKNFWKLAVNSIWYWVLTALVLPSGLAAAGMTNLTRNMAVDTHSFGTSDFFETIKKNWKQALPAGLINLFVLAFLGFDIYFFGMYFKNELKIIGLAVCITLLLIFLVMRYYIWIILITFKLPLKQIYQNSFKLTLLGIKNNLFILLGMAAMYGLCYCLGVTGTGITQFLFYIIVLFVLPGFRFLLIQFNVFGNIKKYMIEPYYKDHPDEDIELRRRLGVYKEGYNEQDII